MLLHRLGGADPPVLQPKAAHLDRLRSAGLPVPEGLVVELAAIRAKAGARRLDRAIEKLLGTGPVIVRSALAIEDRAESSAAGLGLTIGDLRSVAAVREALAAVEEAADTPWLRRLRGPGRAEDMAILQRHVAATAVIVAAQRTDAPTLIEVYDGGLEALSGASSPRFSGPLDRYPDRARSALRALIERAAAPIDAVHGVDLELLVDGEDRLWVAQARPLTAPLCDDAGPLARAVADEGGGLPTRWLRLDADHNPRPLSPAHAWLVRWLAERRPARIHAQVLAGWLFDDLDAAPPPPEDGAIDEPSAALHHLREVEIPAARGRLAAIEGDLAVDERAAIAAAIDPALAAMLAASDALARLEPARARPRRLPEAADVGDGIAACLDERRDFVDILPSAWDVAAPTLGELVESSATEADGASVDAAARRKASAAPERAPAEVADPPPRLGTRRDPDDLAPTDSGDLAPTDSGDLAASPDPDALAVWRLREQDDHLFALGLAPLRRVYLRAAAALGIDRTRVFDLEPPELASALAGDLEWAPLLERREALGRRRAALHPPLELLGGHALPASARGPLGGVGLGPAVSGPIHHRRDLAELLAAPPPAGAIVVMPAFTAPAALVVHELGLQAVCSAHGGALSHAALMARELGLSALLGCRGALELPEGTIVELDTLRGRLRPRL
ncbi:MAG: PEP-utilizing enzyme [Nannocystaceae bacterium]